MLIEYEKLLWLFSILENTNPSCFNKSSFCLKSDLVDARGLVGAVHHAWDHRLRRRLALHSIQGSGLIVISPIQR